MARALAAIAALWLSVLALATPAGAQKRVALVMGNTAYAHEGRLANPTNDARDVTAALRRVGFDDVQAVVDGDLKAMSSALARFARSADQAHVALIYYSGHGLEVDGRNYLLPVDARLEDAADVDFEAVSLDLVVRATERAAKLKMVILDACRNNPFLARMVVRQGKRSPGHGLAAVAPSTGMLVAYAARAGTVAEDGPAGGNSPFTAAFLKFVEQPQLEVRLLLGKVRDEVVKATGRQEPFVYGSLGGEEFFLGPRVSAATTPAAALGPAVSAPTSSQSVSDAAQIWRLIESIEDIPLLEAFRKQYGAANPFFDQLALRRIAALKQAQDQKVAALPAVPAPKPPTAQQGPGPQWPSAPVTLVVPFAAGGSTDVLARVLADVLARKLGQLFMVENRPGAGGAIGSAQVAKAAADGSRFLLGGVATHAIAPALSATLSYDPVSDFVPVAMIGEMPTLVVAGKEAPATAQPTSLVTLAARAGTAGTALTFASAGEGTISHLSCVLLNGAIGANAQHVPYRGTGPALLDLISGQVGYLCADAGSVMASLSSGAVKGLAVLGPSRIASFPDIPTAREMGYPVEVSSWSALFAPKGTPDAIVRRLGAAVGEAVQETSLRQHLEKLGVTPAATERSSGQALAAEIKRELAKWAAAAKAAGIQRK